MKRALLSCFCLFAVAGRLAASSVVATEAEPSPAPSAPPLAGAPGDLFTFQGNPLDPARLERLFEEDAQTLSKELEKQKPDQSRLDFFRSRQELFSQIRDHYGAAGDPAKELEAVEERIGVLELLVPSLVAQARGGLPALSGPPTAEDVTQATRKVAEANAEAARWERERLELDSREKAHEDEVAAVRLELERSQMKRQQHETNLAQARRENRAALEIADIEARVEFRSLALDFFERRLARLEEKGRLLERQKAQAVLEQDRAKLELEYYEGHRRIVVRAFDEAIQKLAIEAGARAQQARLDAQRETKPHARLLATRRAELQEIKNRTALFESDVARMATQGEVGLSWQQKLQDRLELARTGVQKLREDEALHRAAEQDYVYVASALVDLKRRAREMRGRLERSLAEMAEKERELTEVQMRSEVRIAGLKEEFAGERARALRLFEVEFSDPGKADGGWGEQRRVWKELEKETEQLLQEQVQSLITLREGTLGPLIEKRRTGDLLLSELDDFLRLHHRLVRHENRITWAGLCQVPSEITSGVRSLGTWLMQAPRTLSRVLRTQNSIVFYLLTLWLLLAILDRLARRHLAELRAVGGAGARLVAALERNSRLFFTTLFVTLSLRVATLDSILQELLQVSLFVWVSHRLATELLRELLRPMLKASQAREPAALAAPGDPWRHLDTSVRRLLNWAAITVPPLVIFDRCGYGNAAVLDCGWLLSLGGIIILTARFLRPQAILIELLPPISGAMASLARACILFMRPVLLVLLVWVFWLKLRGYHEHAADIFSHTLVSLSAVLLIPMGANMLLGSLTRRFEDVPGESADDTAHRHARAALLKLLKWPVRLLATGLLVLSVFWAWEIPPREALEILRIRLPGVDPEKRDYVSYLDAILFVYVTILTLEAAKFARRLIERTLYPLVIEDKGLAFALSSLSRYIILLVGMILALSYLEIGSSQIQWLLAFAGIGIGFGLQEIVTNFIAGLIMLVERPAQVGDVITVGATEGRIADINIRSTRVQTSHQVDILIPNKKFITDELRNWTHRDPTVYISIAVGVSYDSDVQLVRTVLLEVAGNHGLVLERPPPQVRFNDFGDSSLLFQLNVCIDDPMNRGRIESDLRFATWAAFRRNGIEMPYPQRVVHIKHDHGDEPAEAKKGIEALLSK